MHPPGGSPPQRLPRLATLAHHPGALATALLGIAGIVALVLQSPLVGSASLAVLVLIGWFTRERVLAADDRRREADLVLLQSVATAGSKEEAELRQLVSVLCERNSTVQIDESIEHVYDIAPDGSIVLTTTSATSVREGELTFRRHKLGASTPAPLRVEVDVVPPDAREVRAIRIHDAGSTTADFVVWFDPPLGRGESVKWTRTVAWSGYYANELEHDELNEGITQIHPGATTVQFRLPPGVRVKGVARCVPTTAPTPTIDASRRTVDWGPLLPGERNRIWVPIER